MAKHLTDEEIDLYRRREANPENHQATAAHLGLCQPCLERVLKSEHATVAVDALTEAFLPSTDEGAFHLSHAELKGYLAGSLDSADQVICGSHLEICEHCNEELRRLSAAQKFAPAASEFRFLTPARLAAAVALIGILTLVAFVWWKQLSRPMQQESASNGTQATPGAGRPAGSVAEATPLADNESVPSNSPVVASLKDNGREIRLDQQGRITGLEEFDETTQRLARAGLAGESLTKPRVLDDLSSPPIKLLDQTPAEQSFKIIGPAGNVIAEGRPTLRWTPLSGATSYVVSIYDSSFNRIAQSSRLAGTNWRVDVPLQRGQNYSWEVAATRDFKEITTPVAPAPRAQFRLLEADKVNALSKLKQQQPISHLALGLMYARFGLVSDAEAEFRKLVKENPDSALAKKLLRTVQAWH